MYFLWYFIRKDKTVVYESVHNKRVWVFSPNGCRSFTSPSYKELLLLGNALNIEEKYIHRKFKKYGPDIRFVIQINDEDANDTINKAIAKFDVDCISSYFDGTYRDAAKSNYESVLFKTTVMEAEFNTLQDAYRFKNVQWEFASHYIGNRVIDKFKDSSIDFVKNFFLASKGIPEMIQMAALRGYILELHAPNKISDGKVYSSFNTESESIFEHHFTKLDDIKEVSYSSSLIQDMLKNCTDPKILYNMGKEFSCF
jgi:hypothetical protein